jgi:hypothetical protein
MPRSEGGDYESYYLRRSGDMEIRAEYCEDGGSTFDRNVGTFL